MSRCGAAKGLRFPLWIFVGAASAASFFQIAATAESSRLKPLLQRRGALAAIGLSTVACCWAAQAADAVEARKCAGRDGRNHYVSGPCPPGTREVWSRRIEAAPMATPNARQNWPQGAKRSRPRPSQAGRGRSASLRSESACDAARRRRDETRDRHWYTLTYDQLSALDARVAKACR